MTNSTRPEQIWICIRVSRLHVVVDSAVDEPGDLLPRHLAVGRRVDPLEHRLQVEQLLRRPRIVSTRH